MTSSTGGGRGVSGALGALLSVLLPALLVLGGHLLRGERLLPYLPSANEPLATDHPEQAAHAFDEANLVLADRIYPILTDQIALRGEVRKGHLPLWEPDVNVGAPLLAGTLAGALYPPNALAYALPPEDAAAPLGVLTLALAGLGTWLFLGRLGLGTGARVTAVLATELGGWCVTNLFYYMKVDAALWVPWGFWAIEGLVQGRRRSGLALTAAVALSLLAGFPTISFFGLVFLAAYAVVRLRPGGPRGRGASGWALGALFLGLGVAGGAVQLLPTFEASRHARRQEKTVDAIVSEAMPVTTLLGTLAPDLFGEPTSPTENGHLPVAWWLTPKSRSFQALLANAAEWNTYVGAAILCLALVGLVAAPRRAAFPFLALLACYGFAQAWPGLRLGYRLPGLNLGAPQRILSVAWLLWPWLAALGVEALVSRAPRAAATFGLTVGLLLVAAFAAWVSFDGSTFGPDLQATLIRRYPEESLETIRATVPPDLARSEGERLESLLAHPFAALLSLFLAGIATLLAGAPPRAGLARRGAAAPVLAVLLAAVLATAVAPLLARGRGDLAGVLAGAAGLAALSAGLFRGSAPAAWYPLALVVLAEGLQAAGGHLPGFPRALGPVFPESPGIEAIRTAAGDGRVLRLDTSASGTDAVFRLARPNMLQAYGVQDLSTHSIFTNARLLELCKRVDPRMEFRGSGISRLPAPELIHHPVLDLLRITCLLSVVALEHPQLELVLERPGFHVYRRLGALPPARVVPRAIPVAGDEETLDRLTASDHDPYAGVLVPPTALAGIELPEPGATWHPGQVESFERPTKASLEVRVWGSSGGWLVVQEQYAPGWRATVNGEEVPVVRADHAFRAVPLPRGDSVVHMEYAPPAFRWGLLATLVGLGAAVLLALAPARLRRA